ncbi:PilN domain-containing protein [Terrisporobacter sp.]
MTDINFFEPYENKSGQIEDFYKIFILLLAVVIIGSFSVNVGRKVLLKREIEAYQSKLESTNIKEEIELIEETNKEKDVLSKYKSGLDTILNSMETRDVVSNVILDQISSTVPSSVSFKTMNIDNQVVTIQGESNNRDSIAEMEYNLKALKSVKNVYVENISLIDSLEGKYTFNLKCYLNGGGN